MVAGNLPELWLVSRLQKSFLLEKTAALWYCTPISSLPSSPNSSLPRLHPQNPYVFPSPELATLALEPDIINLKERKHQQPTHRLWGRKCCSRWVISVPFEFQLYLFLFLYIAFVFYKARQTQTHRELIWGLSKVLLSPDTRRETHCLDDDFWSRPALNGCQCFHCSCSFHSWFSF